MAPRKRQQSKRKTETVTKLDEVADQVNVPARVPTARRAKAKVTPIKPQRTRASKAITKKTSIMNQPLESAEESYALATQTNTKCSCKCSASNSKTQIREEVIKILAEVGAAAVHRVNYSKADTPSECTTDCVEYEPDMAGSSLADVAETGCAPCSSDQCHSETQLRNEISKLIIEIGETATKTSTGCYGRIMQNSRKSKGIRCGIPKQALNPVPNKKLKSHGQRAISENTETEDGSKITSLSPDPLRKSDSPICSQAENILPGSADAATNTDSAPPMDTENATIPPDRSPNAGHAFCNMRWFPARIPNQLAITDGKETTRPTVHEANARQRTVNMLDRIWNQLQEAESEVQGEEESRFQIRIIDRGTTERQARSYTIYRFSEAAGLELAEELEYIPPSEIFYTVVR